LPVVRGVAMHSDDLLRGDVIQRLICNNRLDTRALETQYGINFENYFSTELRALAGMQDDGLVEIRPGQVRVTGRGRLLIRNICKIFDKYRSENTEKFSRMI
jgi:oxygen-independent coproporphyrinogen-3 oxidase